MKGLHKVIYPFAPDQSGAVSVLYELGGLLVVVDAGAAQETSAALMSRAGSSRKAPYSPPDFGIWMQFWDGMSSW